MITTIEERPACMARTNDVAGTLAALARVMRTVDGRRSAPEGEPMLLDELRRRSISARQLAAWVKRHREGLFIRYARNAEPALQQRLKARALNSETNRTRFVDAVTVRDEDAGEGPLRLWFITDHALAGRMCLHIGHVGFETVALEMRLRDEYAEGWLTMTPDGKALDAVYASELHAHESGRTSRGIVYDPHACPLLQGQLNAAFQEGSVHSFHPSVSIEQEPGAPRELEIETRFVRIANGRLDTVRTEFRLSRPSGRFG